MFTQRINSYLKEIITVMVISILVSTGIAKAETIDTIAMITNNEYVILGKQNLVDFLESNKTFNGYRYDSINSKITVGYIPNYREAFIKHTSTYWTKGSNSLSWLYKDNTYFTLEDIYKGNVPDSIEKTNEALHTYHLLGDERIMVTNYKSVDEMLAASHPIGIVEPNWLTDVAMYASNGPIAHWGIEDATELYNNLYFVKIWNAEDMGNNRFRDYLDDYIGSDAFAVEIYSGYNPKRDAFTKLYTFLYWGYVGEEEYWMDSVEWAENTLKYYDSWDDLIKSDLYRTRAVLTGDVKFVQEQVFKDMLILITEKREKQTIAEYKKQDFVKIERYFIDEYPSWQYKLY